MRLVIGVNYRSSGGILSMYVIRAVVTVIGPRFNWKAVVMGSRVANLSYPED